MVTGVTRVDGFTRKTGVKGDIGKTPEEYQHLKGMLSKRNPQRRLRVTRKAIDDSGYKHRLSGFEAWLTLSSCLTWGKFFNLSEIRFPHM